MSDDGGFNFQIVNFDANLLGAYFGARQSEASIRSLPPVLSNVSLSNNKGLVTPWDQDNVLAQQRFADDSSSANLYKLLTKDFAAIQNTKNFIDRRDASVRNADLDKDSKGLFILYNALKDLKTIAEFSGDLRTSTAKMESLDKLFQLGYSQVKDFIRTEDFEKLKLLYGEKRNNITSKAGLGKTQYDYIGPQIHSGKITDPVSTLAGGETFTISITRNTSTVDVTSEIVEDFIITIPTAQENRSLEAILASINTQIQTTKTTDAEGEEIPLFKTRFFAEEIEPDKFAFRIKTDFSEKMTFSAPDVEPAIYLTGNMTSIDSLTKTVNGDIPTTSFITKLGDLNAGDATREFHQSVFSDAKEELLIPEKTASTINVSQFANAAATTSNGIATDSSGNFYLIGATEGRFANHLNTAEGGDAYLNKYDATGKLLWGRLVGSLGGANTYDITIDNSDNIIIAGQADDLSAGKSTDPLALGDNIFNGKDSFIIKYDNVGTQQWMYINDQYGTDAAMAVTTDTNGDVYVTGQRNSLELSSTVVGGNDSAYVLKLDGLQGTKSDYVEIGSSTADFGQAIAVAADGNIIVATHEADNLILQKLDVNDLTNEIWSYDYGDMGSGSKINDVIVDGSRIYIAGNSNNSLTGGGSIIDAPKGGLDGFVLAIDDLGATANADWTKFIGSDQTDKSGALTISGGKIYVSGSTSGSIDGGTLLGSSDSFAMKIDGISGLTDWTKQLGSSSENRTANGIAFTSLGSSVLTKLGFPIGQFADNEKRTIATQTTARAGDYFFVKINNLITKKIEIKEGDTYRTLANRINRASFQYIKASVTFNSGSSKDVNDDEVKTFDAKAIIAEKLKQIQDERAGIVTQETFERAKLDVFGNSLKIASKDGGNIEIIAGRGDKDALKKLGIDPTLILSTKELFDLEEESSRNSNKTGGVFAFNLDDRFSVLDKRDARYVVQELEFAIKILQSAFRSLTYDPLAEQIKQDALKKTGGRVPPYLLRQLNNYQDGLNRLTGGSGLIV